MLSLLLCAMLTVAPAPQDRDDRWLGLVASGYGLFGVTYLTGSGTAVAGLDRAHSEADARRERRALLPVAGPFMRAGASDSRTSTAGWALLGVGQLAGLSLAATGTALAIRDVRRHGPLPALAPNEPQRGGGMLAIGSFMVFAGYVSNAAFYAGFHRQNEAQRPYWRRMMLPVVGGFLAAPVSTTAKGRFWGVTSGLTQTAGLALLVAGSVMYARGAKYRGGNTSIAPIMGRQVGLSLSTRF